MRPIDIGKEGSKLVLTGTQGSIQTRRNIAGRTVDQICRGLVNGDRVARDEYADPRHDGPVGKRITVAERGNVCYKADAHHLALLVLERRGSVFHHFFHERGYGLVPPHANGALRAG